MTMRSTVFISCILLAIICVTRAQQITKDTEWELNVDNNGGSLRATSMKRFFNGLWYSSLEVNADKSSGNLNYMSGASAAPLLGSVIAHFPAATLGFFGAQITVEEPTQDDPFKLQADLAAGFMATSFYKIEEKNTTGHVIDTFYLNRNNYQLTDIGTKDSLKWGTYTTRMVRKGGLIPPDTDYRGDLAITFMISDSPGTSNFNTNVGPSTLESIIQISGYQYANAENNLVLSMGVASGSASWEGEVGVVTQQTTDNPVFFKVAKEAMYNLETKPVTVSAFKTATFEAAFGNNVQIEAQLKSKFNGDWEARIVEVEFAAGADLITYDPTLGATMSDDDTSDAVTNSILLMFILLIISMLL